MFVVEDASRIEKESRRHGGGVTARVEACVARTKGAQDAFTCPSRSRSNSASRTFPHKHVNSYHQGFSHQKSFLSSSIYQNISTYNSYKHLKYPSSRYLKTSKMPRATAGKPLPLLLKTLKTLKTNSFSKAPWSSVIPQSKPSSARSTKKMAASTSRKTSMMKHA
jgi:hypothetical protein